MFEYLTLLLPFLLLGFIAAGLSRISGVALSMIIVPTLLIWGATPLDVVAFMLLFVVYNNFTSETQDVRLDYKDLVLFPKWRLLIPTNRRTYIGANSCYNSTENGKYNNAMNSRTFLFRNAFEHGC